MAIATVAASAAQKAKKANDTRKQIKKSQGGRTTSEVVKDKAAGGIGNRPKYFEPRTVAGYRRMLTAEFIICLLMVLYRGWKNRGEGSLTSTDGNSMWRQLGGVWLAFFFLALLSSISWKVARLCAMLGGLITVSVVIADSELFTNLANTVKTAFGSNVDGSNPTPGSDAPTTTQTPTTAQDPNTNGQATGITGNGTSGGGAGGGGGGSFR